MKELKNFYIFTIGQFVSQFGSSMTSYGLILWAYKQSGSVLSTSLLLISNILPKMLLSYFAGNLTARYNKKRIMLITDGIAAVLSLGILGMLFLGQLRLEYLYVINFIFGVADSFQSNASAVTISNIVTKEHYMKTSGIRSFFSSVSKIFYPITATFFYTIGGMQLIIVMDLLTFVFAFTTLLLFVPIPDVTVIRDMSFKEQCLLGLRYMMKRRDILSLIGFMGFVNLIAGIYSSCLTPMVLARNGNNDFQLGVVSSMIGISGLFGSIFVSKMQTNKKITQMLTIMGFSFLICNSMLGIGRNYYIWTIMVFVGNVFIPTVIANEDYIVRTIVPKEMLGKVFAIRSMFQYIAMMIGYFAAGFLTDKILEPFMSRPSRVQIMLSKIVGSGSGSGIALIYLCISALGFIGCILFKHKSSIMSLENVES